MASSVSTSLGLLCDYESENESESVEKEDDVKRCYENKEEGEPTAKKQKTESKDKRLPLPGIFQQHCDKLEEHTDDSSQHGGRVRSFAHERGNWATYVYVPYSQNIAMETLMQNLMQIYPEFKAIEHLHISLTKTVVLKYHWIESFILSTRNSLKNIDRFNICLHDLEVYCNEDNTRTFLGLRVQSGHRDLEEAATALDQCLNEFKLPTFYEDPSFHISILWCVGNKFEEISEVLPQLKDVYNKIIGDSELNSGCSAWSFEVSTLICKTGNKLYNFSLL